MLTFLLFGGGARTDFTFRLDNPGFSGRTLQNSLRFDLFICGRRMYVDVADLVSSVHLHPISYKIPNIPETLQINSGMHRIRRTKLKRTSPISFGLISGILIILI
jgi:hypothetical protein